MSKRFNKFKSKNVIFMIVLKMALVWYLIIFSASYLTSNTAAYFNDYKSTDGMITLGTWKPDNQDESALAFTTKGNQNIKACKPVVIKIKVQNKGKGDMKNDNTYDIYYIENGNPEKHGEKLALAKGEGIIKALKSGEVTELTYQTSKPGVYVFSIVQPNGKAEQQRIWSKWIDVHCPTNKKSSTNDKVEKDQAKQGEIGNKQNEENIDLEVESNKEKEAVTEQTEKESTEKNKEAEKQQSKDTIENKSIDQEASDKDKTTTGEGDED